MAHRLLPGRPELYHGKESGRPYFEGWYFKHSQNGNAFVAIPGIFRGRDKDADTAFIQIILTDPQRSFFVKYPAEEFISAKESFFLRIGSNSFSLEKTELNIQEINLKASLRYSGLTPLETNLLSPSIMGPFSYLPAMQCNHGILSLRHEVNGFVEYKGLKTHYDAANGYIEKDWGEAFPESWVWMQGCGKDSGLMCSAAVIPYGPFRFKGLIAVLSVQNRQYRFATYNCARLSSLDIRGNEACAELKRGEYKLKIRALNDGFIKLKAPAENGMDRELEESICARLNVTLLKKESVVFSDSFENGGLEISDALCLHK